MHTHIDNLYIILFIKINVCRSGYQRKFDHFLVFFLSFEAFFTYNWTLKIFRISQRFRNYSPFLAFLALSPVFHIIFLFLINYFFRYFFTFFDLLWENRAYLSFSLTQIVRVLLCLLIYERLKHFELNSINNWRYFLKILVNCINRGTYATFSTRTRFRGY